MDYILQTVLDRVRFIMPRDYELLVAAMTIVQNFVNGYDEKMNKPNPAQPVRHVRFALRYELVMEPGMLELFERFGLRLMYAPIKLEGADMVVDMSDERIMNFANTGKHVGQICGILSGIGTLPLPVVHRILPDANAPWLCEPTLEQLLALNSGDICGVIGKASIATYMAAAMGIGVVEIIPATRSPKWLSKHVNRLYRIVIEGDDQFAQIMAAQDSIRKDICSAAQVASAPAGG